jgi:hypothetical protein
MLPYLHLDDINDFWTGDTIVNRNHTEFGLFRRFDGFLEGFIYSSMEKSIAVSVFKSQSLAINAIEEWGDDISATIKPGDSYQKIREIWWQLDGTLFINKWNTLVQVEYSGFNTIIDELIENTAIEVANRVDMLSVPVQPEMNTLPWYINNFY